MSSAITNWRNRIVSTPGICGGRARIAGTRITVSIIFDNLAAGLSWDEIIKEYPKLIKDDITSALQFQAYISDNRKLQKIIWNIQPISVKKEKSRKNRGRKFNYSVDVSDVIDLPKIKKSFAKIITKQNVTKKIDLLIEILSGSEEIDLDDFISIILFFYASASETDVTRDVIGMFIKKYYKKSLSKLKRLQNMHSNESVDIENKSYRITEIGMEIGAINAFPFLNHIR